MGSLIRPWFQLAKNKKHVGEKQENFDINRVFIILRQLLLFLLEIIIALWLHRQYFWVKHYDVSILL